MTKQRMTLPHPVGHADDLTKDLLAKGSITPSDLHSGNCIHPACLRASLEQSLVTLNLEAVRHKLKRALQLGSAHHAGFQSVNTTVNSPHTWVLSSPSRGAHGAAQVDLLHLHNAAEMQLGAVGKRRFVERLAAAFREMEQFR